MYSYNDAMFSANDWLGIRMLQQSVKEKDPNKVGRFGLGFKSVFHITGTILKCFQNSVATLNFIILYPTYDSEL